MEDGDAEHLVAEGKPGRVRLEAGDDDEQVGDDGEGDNADEERTEVWV